MKPCRKPSKRERLIRELASIQRVVEDKPKWFRQADYSRLTHEFATKSAELIALEIASYRKRLGM